VTGVQTCALPISESLVDAAERERKDAGADLAQAKSTYNDLAEQFNQSAWIWGGLSGLALISTIVFGVLFGLQSKKQRKVEEIEARPDWDCPECSTHNEGGMFCVSCGFAKSELKATQAKKSKASQAKPKDEESQEKSEAQSED
jgi:membrane protease subunit (stomatin/prohibitin family)